MLDTLGPAHFTHVNQPFDAILELDKRAVVGQAYDDALANPIVLVI